MTISSVIRSVVGPVVSSVAGVEDGYVATATALTIPLPVGTRQVTFGVGSGLSGDIYVAWGSSAPADGTRIYIANGADRTIGCAVGTTDMTVLAVNPAVPVPVLYTISTTEFRYFNPQVFYGVDSGNTDITLTLPTAIAGYGSGFTFAAGMFFPDAPGSNCNPLTLRADSLDCFTHLTAAANDNAILNIRRSVTAPTTYQLTGHVQDGAPVNQFNVRGVEVTSANCLSFDNLATTNIETDAHTQAFPDTSLSELIIGKNLDAEQVPADSYMCHPWVALGYTPSLADWNALLGGAWPGRILYGQDVVGWILADSDFGLLDGSGRGCAVAQTGSGTLTEFESVTETTGFEVPTTADSADTLDADYTGSLSALIALPTHQGVVRITAPDAITVEFYTSADALIDLTEASDRRLYDGTTTERCLIPLNAAKIKLFSTDTSSEGTANVVPIIV